MQLFVLPFSVLYLPPVPQSSVVPFPHPELSGVPLKHRSLVQFSAGQRLYSFACPLWADLRLLFPLLSSPPCCSWIVPGPHELQLREGLGRGAGLEFATSFTSGESLPARLLMPSLPASPSLLWGGQNLKREATSTGLKHEPQTICPSILSAYYEKKIFL